MRLAVLVALAALVFPSAALAAGPSYVAEGGAGVLSRDGQYRYVAVPVGGVTAVERIAVRSGAVRGWTVLDDVFGIPQPTMSPSHLEGLTRDGRRLIVATVPVTGHTSFAVVDTGSMHVADRFELSGDFAYDALSPDGETLYLTQHVDRNDANRYVVRAFDLGDGRLLPRTIADKTQRGWVMEGFATTRTTSADGRWVYTLFMRPGGIPFVHALDTVRGVAHCIGLPWTARDQGPLMRMRMTLTHGGHMLALRFPSGRTWLAIDTATWRIQHRTSRRDGFPAAWLGVATGLLAALAVTGLVARRKGGALRSKPA